MSVRRNDFDVTDQVRTTDPQAVQGEVSRIYAELYAPASDLELLRPFADASRLYHGDFPGHRACDTAYHNLQHVLDVTLAMARLMDGSTRAAHGAVAFDERLFRFGIVLALFHDAGYIRSRHDTRADNGAAYTRTHVSRGGRFLERYLGELGLADLIPVAGPLVHFTGYERPVGTIDIADPTLRRLGLLLGSADIVAQMSDRCYLEKCRDRLYPEFVIGGIAAGRDADGKPNVLFASAEDLVVKTPGFYRVASRRLEHDLEGVYRLAEPHFRGQNLYLEELEKNIRHAETVAEQHDLSLLRRSPPPAETAGNAEPASETRQDAPATRSMILPTCALDSISACALEASPSSNVE
ncbi:MAG: hypothetical protein K2X67_07900 [Burkholderiales bacterium]|nr:hypothetical protein [Burkholderiales bacterium]